MTCQFCSYEFCWACGASASADDRHFSFFNGCGVKMMDKNVKPNSISVKERKICKEICLNFLKVILTIIALPFILVLFPPCYLAFRFAKVGLKKSLGPGTVFLSTIGFLLGLLVIPFFAIAVLLYIAIHILYGVLWVLTCGWFCSSYLSKAEAEQAKILNRERAEQ